MKKSNVKSRILSVLLVLSIVVNVMPMGQITTQADVTVNTPNVSYSTTGHYANIVTDYAEMQVDKNKGQDSYASYDFTWTTETGKGDSWRYYNGIMLDALMELNAAENYNFVKSVYDNGNLESDGSIVNWHDNELDSVPMGLALFDIINNLPADTTTTTQVTNSIDISQISAINGTGTVTEQVRLKINGTNTNPQYNIEIPASITINSGTTVSVRVTGTWGENDDSATLFRIRLSKEDTANDSANTSNKAEVAGMVVGETFDKTVNLTVSADGSKYIVIQAQGSQTLKDLAISGIYITVDETTTALDINNIKLLNGKGSVTKEVKLNATSGSTSSFAIPLSAGVTNGDTVSVSLTGTKINDSASTGFNSYLRNNDSNDISESKWVNITASDDGSYTTTYDLIATADTSSPYVVLSGVNDITISSGTITQNVTTTNTSTDKAKYQNTIQEIFTHLENQDVVENSGGNYYHKGKDNADWKKYPVALDGLYMAQTFLMECANAISNNKISSLTASTTSTGIIDTNNVYQIHEDVYNRMIWVSDNLYNEDTQLYNHSAGFNSDGKLIKNGVFWSRAIGWYAMALIDTIELMPSSGTFTASDGKTEMNYATMRTELINRLIELFDGMLRYQDTDTGMWTNIVNEAANHTYDNGNINKFETSGTAMMAYALTKAYNLQLVSDKYCYAGLRAFNGLHKTGMIADTGTKYTNTTSKLEEIVYKVSNIYKSAGVSTDPSVYCGNNYVDDEAKGTAPLIKAGIEARLAAETLNGNMSAVVPGVLYDSETEITVETDDAVAMTPNDVSDLEAVKSTVGDILDAGYEAWDLTFATCDATGSNTTIVDASGVGYIQIPEGVTAKTLSVYYIDSNNQLVPVTAVVNQYDVVAFTMDHAGTYVFGAEKVWDDLSWKEVEFTDEYEPVYSMTHEVPEGESSSPAYVITQPGTADGEKYALGYNNATSQKSYSTQLEAVEDGFIFHDVSIDENTEWKIDDAGHIYCVIGGTPYYLKEEAIGNLATTSEFSVKNGITDETYNELPVYEGISLYVQCNPEFKGGYVKENGNYVKYEPLYETYSSESKITKNTINGSLALYASASANFVEDAAGSTKPNNYFYYWAKNVNNNNDKAQDAAGLTNIHNQLKNWHQVAVVITNDSVIQYVDGQAVSTNILQNVNGDVFGKNTDSYGPSFNRGYGYATFGPADTDLASIKSYNQNGINILDFITDENTEVTIGGTPYSVQRNSNLAQATDGGVYVDDIKFYSIPFTSEQVQNPTAITQDALKEYEFLKGSYPGNDYKGVGIVADPNNSENGALKFNTYAETVDNQEVTSNGYAKIDNPYIEYDFSEALTLQDGYPSWTKGVTITYRIYVSDSNDDTPVIVFNNSKRQVMTSTDEDKYNICAEYDIEAAAAGKNLTFTTNSAEAVKWSTHRVATGTQLVAVSKYTNEFIYLKAPASSGGIFTVTSNENAVALWSKTGDEAPLGPEATLTGTLEHFVIKDYNLTLDDIKEQAQIYYRESKDSDPYIISNSSDNVKWIWKNTLDCSTVGTYVLEVYYDDDLSDSSNGEKLGEITVEVQDTDWISSYAYDENEIEGYLYEPVTTMDPEYPFGYVIAEQAAFQGGNAAGTYASLTVDNSNSNKINVTLADAGNGLYSISSVSDSNLWHYDADGYLYVLDNGVKKYLYSTGGSDASSMGLTTEKSSATKLNVYSQNNYARIDGIDNASISIKYMENMFQFSGANYLSMYKKVPVKYLYEKVTSMDESNTSGYVIAAPTSVSAANGLYMYINADTGVKSLGRYNSIIMTETSSGSGIYEATKVPTNPYLWYFDKNEDSADGYGAIYCLQDGVRYYITYGDNPQLVTESTDSVSIENNFVIDNVQDDKSVNIGFPRQDGKTGTFYYRFANGVTMVSQNQTSFYIYSKTAPVIVEPSVVASQASLIGKTEYTIYAGATSIEEYQILQNVGLYVRESENSTPQLLDWNAEGVEYEWNAPLSNTTDGTYTMTVTYFGKKIGTVDVTVKTPESGTFTDGLKFKTYKGRVPDLSSLQYTVSYDGYEDVITIDNGLVIENLDVSNTVNDKLVNVLYNNVVVGSFSLTVVDDDVYAGLDDATELPVYPEPGSVRITKSASNDEFTFYETGVTKLELTAAGVASNGGLDVVLITDVSNSMAWTDNWFNTYPDATKDAYKIPQLGNYSSYEEAAAETKDKLDAAMEAATNFATTLLASNDENEATNNSISFVTFAGNDKEHLYNTATYGNYIDAVQTVFVGVQDIEKARTSFSNTKFIKSVPTSSQGAEYTLQIGKTNGVSEVGLNRGNTNYDFAYAQAAQAVEELQSKYENYEETGRKTIVLFMSDGAPSHYNDVAANGAGSDYLYGTKSQYTEFSATGTQDEKNDAWLNAIKTPNKYAAELGNRVDSFYGVGFDLNHGGFSDYSWTKDELKPVFQNMAGTNAIGKQRMIEVLMADSSNELLQKFDDIASMLVYSGTDAWVTDIVGSEFDAAFGTAIRDLDGNVLDTDKSTAEVDAVIPDIEILWYELYTADTCGDNEALIGTRTGKAPTVIERVTFTDTTTDGADGNKIVTVNSAKSNQMGDTNIYTDNGTTITITGKYFTYTKVKQTGVETFKWNVGVIDEGEYALNYYAYLTGSGEGWREANTYPTNTSAILEYIDVDGNKATQTYDIPVITWGSATTIIEYYMVNQNGQPIDEDGNVVAFADKVLVPINDTGIKEMAFSINWESSETIKADAYLPKNQALYSPGTEYTVTVDATGIGTLDISDSTYKVGSTSEITTVWRNKGAIVGTNSENQSLYNVELTRVSFAVVKTVQKEVQVPFGIDRVVVDYGKPIQVDVLANNTGIVASNYTVKVVGFRHYETDKELVQYTQSSKGVESLPEEYGIFTVVDDDTVQFTMTKLLDKVQKVFTVVEVTEKGTADYFYMYQELEVIPATNMYYETEFGTDVFTFKQADGADGWTIKPEENETYDKYVTQTVQDDGTVGVDQTYGFDASYTYDAGYSDDSSYFVEGQGSSKTVATFEFTGTGFDIISRTGALQGMINVKVYKVVDGVRGDRVKNVSVLNKSSDATDGSEVQSNRWELYQVPVMSIEGLEHGTYSVDIGVLKASQGNTGSLAAILNRGGEFYFDAIRIYDPIDVTSGTDYDFQFNYGYTDGSTDEKGNTIYLDPEYVYDKDIALTAYKDDNEAYQTIDEVRNLLISAGDFDAMDGDEDKTGAVFLDRNYGDNEVTYTVSDYAEAGPNNELYLQNGQLVTFKLTLDNYENLVGIDIGGKCVKTVGMTDRVYTGTSLNAKIMPCINGDIWNYPIYGEVNKSWITSSTNQYYPIIAKNSADINSDVSLEDVFKAGNGSVYVYIQNYQNAILSVTDIKLTYSTKPVSRASFTISRGMVEVANQMMIDLDYDIQSVSYNGTQHKLFSNATMIVETSRYVDDLKLVNTSGSPITTKKTYVDSKDGTRTWTITTILDDLGEQTYVITGYGADGTAGESEQITFEVSHMEGDGWQDAKSIYKTLFNCRILSIERGSSY